MKVFDVYKIQDFVHCIQFNKWHNLRSKIYSSKKLSYIAQVVKNIDFLDTNQKV